MAETMDTGVRPSEGVRTQNLRDFTIQIRRGGTQIFLQW